MSKSAAFVSILVMCLTACSQVEPTFTAGQVISANKDWTPFSKTINDVDMMKVPPGCFMMGSDVSDDEAPINKVCFDKPFWIDKTEVSAAQFKKFGGQKASVGMPADELPITRISWFESRDYCAKRGARLPTEAEWEYAARGPDNLRWPWGTPFDINKVVWNSVKTAPVGSIPAGASWVGALDLAGNVFEWVSSIYKPYPYVATDGRENPDDSTSLRSLRGGAMSNLDGDLGPSNIQMRSSTRNAQKPDWNLLQDTGLRCARSDT